MGSKNVPTIAWTSRFINFSQKQRLVTFTTYNDTEQVRVTENLSDKCIRTFQDFLAAYQESSEGLDGIQERSRPSGSFGENPTGRNTACTRRRRTGPRRSNLANKNISPISEKVKSEERLLSKLKFYVDHGARYRDQDYL